MKKLLILGLSLFALIGCSSKKTAGFMDYFKEVEGDPSTLEFSYDGNESDGYSAFVDNYDTEKFIGVDLTIYDDSEKELGKYSWNMIRPGLYVQTDVYDVLPTTYVDENYKYYEFDYLADFMYSYLYYTDEANGDYTLDVFKTGGFNEEEIEKVAKQEYIIACATDDKIETLIFIDYDENAEELNYTYDGVKTKAYLDYSKKTIEVVNVEGGSETPAKTIQMDF